MQGQVTLMREKQLYLLVVGMMKVLTVILRRHVSGGFRDVTVNEFGTSFVYVNNLI